MFYPYTHFGSPYTFIVWRVHPTIFFRTCVLVFDSLHGSENLRAAAITIFIDGSSICVVVPYIRMRSRIVRSDMVSEIRQEMWLADFRMRSTKKLEVHRNLHIDSHGHKVVTLENVECVVQRDTPFMPFSRLTFIGFESIQRWVAALDFMATRAQRNLGRLHSKRPRHSPPS